MVQRNVVVVCCMVLACTLLVIVSQTHRSNFGLTVVPGPMTVFSNSHFDNDKSGNLTICNNSIEMAPFETAHIVDCISNFKTFRESAINGGEMEHVRVHGHTYLNANSRVLEVGGYTGEDASRLIAKYNPNYMVMEPMPRFYKRLEERYKDNKKMKLFKFGLGKEAKTLRINVASDATSLFKEKRPPSEQTNNEEAHIHEITNFFADLDVKHKPIDLISINCEGCEYDLIEVLTTSGIVNYLNNIQFQFHLDLPGIAHQECRYCQLMTLLSRTHKPSWQYKYTWQCWTKK